MEKENGGNIVKKIVTLIIGLLITTAVFAQNEPVEGFWLIMDNETNRANVGWQIYIENGIVYGKILSIANRPRGIIAESCREHYNGFPIQGRVNTMPIAGTPWIFGLTKHRNGEWRGGKIIDSESGSMYNCRIIFRPADGRKFQYDTLEVRAELAFGIGRSLFFQRTDEATASNLWPD